MSELLKVTAVLQATVRTVMHPNPKRRRRLTVLVVTVSTVTTAMLHCFGGHIRTVDRSGTWRSTGCDRSAKVELQACSEQPSRPAHFALEPSESRRPTQALRFSRSLQSGCNRCRESSRRFATLWLVSPTRVFPPQSDGQDLWRGSRNRATAVVEFSRREFLGTCEF